MEKKKKKEFQAPHTFVILVALLLIAVIATYLVPAGSFTRYVDEASGRTLVEAGSYVLTESHPVSFLQIPVIIYRAIVKAASVVAFLLVIGGAFELVTETGSISALCAVISRKLKGHEYFVIPIFLIMFAIFGTTMGMSTEVAVFVPIGITLAYSLGLDKVTGTAMIAMGAAVGFTSGLLNPFNVGVAQDIAELPMYSGIGYRALLLAVLLVVNTVYIIAYAKKVQKDPTKSIIYGDKEAESDDFGVDLDASGKISGRQVAILLVVFVTFAVLIYGLMKLDWYFEEMAGLFIAMGVIAGAIYGMNPNKIASTFGQGAKSIVVGALIVGIARSIELVLSDAGIIDTIINAIANVVITMPHSVQGIGMFIAQSFCNVLITSGTGQAAVTMPLMTPVADLVGISRQTAVLAFQMGDGFSNSILPTSSALMGYLVVSKIPYSKWLKFMVPLFLIWTLVGCIFMVGAIAIGY